MCLPDRQHDLLVPRPEPVPQEGGPLALALALALALLHHGQLQEDGLADQAGGGLQQLRQAALQGDVAVLGTGNRWPAEKSLTMAARSFPNVCGSHGIILVPRPDTPSVSS